MNYECRIVVDLASSVPYFLYPFTQFTYSLSLRVIPTETSANKRKAPLEKSMNMKKKNFLSKENQASGVEGSTMFAADFLCEEKGRAT